MGLMGEIWADFGLHINQGSFSAAAAELQSIDGKISNFSSTSQTLLASAFLVPAGVVTGIAAIGTQLASSMQDASASLTTVYGSADIAKEKFQWLQDFAASTPFEFPELLDATVRLKAYGIEAQDYMGILGDTASAMGKTLSDSVEMLSDAQTGEFERLKEFGVKAVQITTANYAQLGATIEQAGQTALTYTDKYGQAQLKVIDRNNREAITAALVGVDGIFQKYTGAMETRSKTLSGMFSTLKDNLSFALVDLIGFKDMEVQSLSLMGVMQGLMGVAVELTTHLSDIPEPIQAIITVSALAVVGIGLLAAGFIAYGAVLPLVTAGGAAYTATIGTSTIATALFGTTLSAAIWPVTLIVGGLALLAGGLVLLEEKTGLVSTAWQLLSDVVTIVWDYISTKVSEAVTFLTGLFDSLSVAFDGFLATQNMLFSLANPFEMFGTWASGAIDNIHGVAEGVRSEGQEIKKTTDEAGQSTIEAAGKVEQGSSMWTSAYNTLTGNVTGNNDKISNSTQKATAATSDSWQKAIEKMEEYNKTLENLSKAGLENTGNSALNSKLTTGIQGAEGLLGYNPASGQLVLRDINGIEKALNSLNGTQDMVFHGIDKNYAIIIDDGSRTAEQLKKQEDGFRSMGNEVVIVKAKMDLTAQTVDKLARSLGEAGQTSLAPVSKGFDQVTDSAGQSVAVAGNLQTWLQNVNNTSMSNAIAQLGYLEQKGVITSSEAQALQGWLVAVNGTSQTNATAQVGNIATKTKESSIGAGTLKTGLDNVNSTSQANATGQVMGIGSQATVSNGFVGILTTGLNITNNTSQANATGQVAGIGSQSTISNGLVGNLTTGLNITNQTSQANATSQVGGIGSQATLSNGLVGNLTTGLNITNSTSLGSVTSGVSGIGTSANNSSSNVSGLHSWIAGLNNISLSSIESRISNLISNAQSAWNTVSNIANNAISSASNAINTASKVNKSAATLNVPNSVIKISTYNNFSSSTAINSLKGQI